MDVNAQPYSTTNKLRILYVNSFYPPNIGGGAERTIQRLANGIKNRGHEVAVFTTSDKSYDDYVDNIKVFRRKIRNIYWHYTQNLPGKMMRMAWHWKDRSSAGMLRDLETVIAEFEPDIVSFHNLPGVSVTAWSAPKKFGAKCVQVAHDLNLICPNSSMFKHGTSCSKQCTSCWIWRSGFKEKSKTIDAFVGISQFIADRIIDQGMFSKSNMRVINNSQSIADTQPPNVIGLPRFGFLGSLIPAKGIGWILDRWPPEIALEIAGRGSEAYLAELKSKASGKNVRFVGYVDSSNFIQSVDAIVIPSLWNEALGGVAIEAAANRRPVIAANRGGLPEIVKDGVNGLLYDPDVAGDFEQALRKMTANSNLFSALADNSRQSVGHFLDMERFLSQYEMLYYELLQ